MRSRVTPQPSSGRGCGCRVVVCGPRQRNHPDLPLRGFVRCDVCGRPLTGSWSKGRKGSSTTLEAVDDLDVQGILAFAVRILPRASDLWVQASLDYKQRLQQLFFPEGIAFDGNRFNRTAATAPLFKYLPPSESADERVGTRIFTMAARTP